MADGSRNEQDSDSLERAIQRQELCLFRTLLDVLGGAAQSRNAIEREAAFRLSAKLKRCLCASGLNVQKPVNPP